MYMKIVEVLWRCTIAVTVRSLVEICRTSLEMKRLMHLAGSYKRTHGASPRSRSNHFPKDASVSLRLHTQVAFEIDS